MGILNGLGMLDILSDDERSQLEIFCQEKVLQKGEVLFKEGDEANAMYFLKDGEVKISKNIEGKNIKLGHIYAEDILGEMAIFGETGKRMATAEALQNTSLITILSFSIKGLTEQYPEILNKIKEIIELRNYKNKMLGDK